jgi:hypothetical protein
MPSWVCARVMGVRSGFGENALLIDILVKLLK